MHIILPINLGVTTLAILYSEMTIGRIIILHSHCLSLFLLHVSCIFKYMNKRATVRTTTVHLLIAKVIYVAIAISLQCILVGYRGRLHSNWFTLFIVACILPFHPHQ